MLADPPTRGRALLLAHRAGRNSEQCSVHPYAYACMCMYTCACADICMCIYVRVSIYVYVCVCIYLHVYRESLSVCTFPSLPAPHGTKSSCGRLDESLWHGLLQRCSPGCAELRTDAGRELHPEHRHLGACLAQEQQD